MMSRLFKNYRGSAKKTTPENRKEGEKPFEPTVFADSPGEIGNPVSVLETRRRTNPIEFDEGFEIGLEELTDIRCEVGTDQWLQKWEAVELYGGYDGVFDGDCCDFGCDCDCD